MIATNRTSMIPVAVASIAAVASLAAAARGQQGYNDDRSLIVASVVQQVREPAEHIPHTVVAEIRAHVVQVKVYGAGGAIHSGSGTYLGDRIVLTAAHVVEGAHRARVNFPNPDNDQGPFLDSLVGNVRATDATWDQAVIELESLPRHNPPGSPLAPDNPTTGDKVNFAGYPGGKQLRVMRGEFQNYATARGQVTADWFDADAGVVSGYSGGAAYNDAGQLYGNLWGSTGHSTVAVCLGRTKRFLFPWNARLEAWRLAVMTGNAGKMQWGYCPPGTQCPPQQRQPRYIEPGDEGVPPPGQPGQQPGSLIPVQPPTQAPTQPPVAIPDATDIGNQIDAIVGRIDGIVGKLDNLKGCECDPSQKCTCDNTPTAEPGKHFVVIGDPKADYFNRLKTDVEKTATYFDAITLHPPPQGKNVGTLPAIVMYVGATSVFTHRGVIPVQSQLNKIRNGEFQ